ncbi:MAG: hypothetical protein U0031_16515 [Thermomicrobiales bacterium]
MATRSEFGESWEEVVANWYLGVSPPIPGHVAWEALAALERLCPGRLDRILRGSAKGILTMAGVIDTGLILLSCEDLPGFRKIVARINRESESRAALSEATVLASLLRAGYQPLIEPVIEGKSPDGMVIVGDVPVYFETVTPDLSEENERARSDASRLLNELHEITSGRSVRLIVDVEPDPRPGYRSRIVEFARQLVDAPGEAVYELPGDGTLQVAPDHGSSLNPKFLEMADLSWPSEMAQVVIVRHQESDERTHRLLQSEAKHFSPAESNILVINASAISGLESGWQQLVERWFQPGRNRRIGAVVMFWSGIEDKTVRRRWSIIRNPYSHRGIPAVLFDDLLQLNDLDFIYAKSSV